MKLSKFLVGFLSVAILGILTLNFKGDLLAHTDYGFPDASEGQINEALQKTVPIRFLPSSPFFFLISAKEKIKRVFQPSAVKRAEFDMIVSGKRLKEAYLLLLNNDVAGSSRTLVAYATRLKAMNSQIEKARSQNQDVAAQVGEIAETLRVEETLLAAIGKKWGMFSDSDNFDEHLGQAVTAFIDTVLVLDNIKPGLKDRFKTATSSADLREIQPVESPLPAVIEATPSTAPRRIIY